MSERIGLVVESGRLEVHAYCFMTNHLHLLVRSPKGELSAAMRDILGPYTKRFNWRRERDGPLVRGRFFSRPIDVQTDRFGVVRYIDDNPRQAGLTDHITDYPLGSAWHYARGTGPTWLRRDYVEGAVCQVAQTDRCTRAAYLDALGGPFSAEAAWRMEQRLARGLAPEKTELDLVLATQPVIQQWLVDAAKLADGIPIALSLTSPDAILGRIESLSNSLGEWPIRPRKRPTNGWHALSTGLLHTAARVPRTEIAAALGIARTTVNRLLRDHAELMTRDEEYARRAAAVLHAELHPGR